MSGTESLCLDSTDVDGFAGLDTDTRIDAFDMYGRRAGIRELDGSGVLKLRLKAPVFSRNQLTTPRQRFLSVGEPDLKRGLRTSDHFQPSQYASWRVVLRLVDVSMCFDGQKIVVRVHRRQAAGDCSNSQYAGHDVILSFASGFLKGRVISRRTDVVYGILRRISRRWTGRILPRQRCHRDLAALMKLPG